MGSSNIQIRKLIAVIVLLLLVIPFLLGFDDIRNITVKYDGLVKEIKTSSIKPQEIFQAAGVKLEPGDSWKIEDGMFIHDGSVITVLRGKPVTIVRDGVETAQKSTAATVGDALDGFGISYRKKKVYPEVTAEIKPDMRIYVLSSGERLKFTEEKIPPPVEYRDDGTMDEGAEKLEKEGTPGKMKVISKVVRTGFLKTATEKLDEEVLEKPVPKIVRRGTASTVLTPAGYKRYSRKMNVEATAYTIAEGSGTGLTSIGIVPYEGIVAVDPDVIPYYTKMYIPGYGIAMAGDCGGAIEGNIIDLYMEDINRAIHWGRRYITIYILEG